MPVFGKSSRTSSLLDIKRMVKAREFFPVGEMFWYTPLKDQNVELLIQPEKHPSGMYTRTMCNSLCALRKWCGEDGTYIGDVNYTPECHGENREDNESVYFKEV